MAVGSCRRRTPIFRPALAVAACALLVTTAALLVGPGTAGASGGSAGLPAFYRVPAHVPSTPGSLIKQQKVATSGVAGTTYRVMYVSTSLSTKPVAVTGLVFVPRGTPPSGGFPVVSWGHGTNGMAEQCAPSLTPGTTTATRIPELNALLAQGWVVAASDYQGEGTPGPLPYLVGTLAARNTIDIVRAAQHLRAAHAGPDYVVWGHSEGGLTAMFALHVAASYAPTLHLEGVVAGAPPSQFALIYTFLKTSPYRFYLYMAAIGYAKGYGPKAAPLGSILTKAAIKLEPAMTKGCYAYVAKTVDRYSLKQLVKVNPFDVPAWKTLFEENDPEYFTSAAPAPLLIVQGGADTTIPPISTQILAQHLCGVGQDLERWIYPGMTHTGVITASIGDMVHWIRDRFAGVADPDPYQPVGMTGVQTTTCP
jgi:pimeloyl-ACP methyl ester carboxylesterase